MTDIDWGYNCLTSGVHHGRPEEVWDLPLFQAAYMFGEEQLKELVLSRIFSDAMQYVEHGDEKSSDITTPEWAERVKEYAEKIYLSTLKLKIDEISKYYQSAMWKQSQEHIIHLVKENKLTLAHNPRHSHDSLNMLCRIIGVSSSRMVS